MVLEPGTFEVHGTLRIAASGLVLHGSGSGGLGTRIELSAPPHRLLQMRSTGTPQAAGNVRI